MIRVSQIGNAVIRRRADEVAFPLGRTERALIKRLITSMRRSNLVGMAAPQIGKSIRIFVTEVRKTRYRNMNTDKLRVFINPEIVSMSDATELGYEGCGSVAQSELFGEVERAKEISVRWYDEEGKQHSNEFSGFLARVIQHEYDHLEGIVFLDKLKTTRTAMSGSEFRRRMRKR
jgi:peptide deformylase